MILRVFAEQEKPMLSLFSKPQVLEASVEWCRSMSWQTFWQLLPWRLFDVDAMAVVKVIVSFIVLERKSR